MIEPKRKFMLIPLSDTPDSIIDREAARYDLTRRDFRQTMKPFRLRGGVGPVFTQIGVGGSASCGAIVDIEKLTDLALTHQHPDAEHFLEAYQTFDIKRFKAANEEIFAVIKQLKNLGHRVSLEKEPHAKSPIFTSEALKAGAELRIQNAQDAANYGMHDAIGKQFGAGNVWARDRHVKIDGEIEKPVDDYDLIRAGFLHVFGEGGAMVQVGPKEWVVADYIMHDPRIEQYTKKGHTFHVMPFGLMHDYSFTDLLGEPVFVHSPHLDFNLGGIPEKKVVAVCPHYMNHNGSNVKGMVEKLGLTLVEVPKEEANRHPANFLPLGNGQVLVDSGAPKFIQRLKDAGVHAIPTVKPLDNILIHKGGLHCLFNEL